MKAPNRRDRILDAAIELAAEGGFENVRQRDVAARAEVALGTLYKSFRSKEVLLSAALERDTNNLAERLAARPVIGATSIERVCELLAIATRKLCRRPHYARAVLRAVASGEPEVAGNVVAYYGRMTGMVLSAMRGGRLEDTPVSEDEATLARLLLQVWFAALVGWSAGLHGQAQVNTQLHTAAGILFRGIVAL